MGTKSQKAGRDKVKGERYRAAGKRSKAKIKRIARRCISPRSKDGSPKTLEQRIAEANRYYSGKRTKTSNRPTGKGLQKPRRLKAFDMLAADAPQQRIVVESKKAATLDEIGAVFSSVAESAARIIANRTVA